MNLNDLLLREGIDPEQVLVFRHAPREPQLRKELPKLAAEEPNVFNAYQQSQGKKLERVMQTMSGTGYIASFIGHEAGKALFVGLYSIRESKPLTCDEYWNVPGNIKLKEFRYIGEFEYTDKKRSSVLWFDLAPTDFYDFWKGKLVVGWPNWPWGARSWWRRAHHKKNKFPVLAVLEDSLLPHGGREMNDSDIIFQNPVKEQSYRRLVEKRKGCRRCVGLTNPADERYRQFDSDHIGPWSRWQGNLDADLLIVGQDWGDTSYFLKKQGRDQASGNTTNEKLQELLKQINIHIKKPRETQNQILFFTNLVLCLKEGGLQGPVYDQWFKNCVNSFFRPLVDIIKPKAVLALGEKASKSILNEYGIKYPKTGKLERLLDGSPYRLVDSSTVLFPLYHCGARGVRNRSMNKQRDDWTRIAEWLKRKSNILGTGM